jgi:hypothetical protein
VRLVAAVLVRLSSGAAVRALAYLLAAVMVARVVAKTVFLVVAAVARVAMLVKAVKVLQTNVQQEAQEMAGAVAVLAGKAVLLAALVY